MSLRFAGLQDAMEKPGVAYDAHEEIVKEVLEVEDAVILFKLLSFMQI